MGTRTLFSFSQQAENHSGEKSGSLGAKTIMEHTCWWLGEHGPGEAGVSLESELAVVYKYSIYALHGEDV